MVAGGNLPFFGLTLSKLTGRDCWRDILSVAVYDWRVAAAIRTSLSPRFVPDRLIAAPGIPRTLSGKKQELPIKRLFAGWPAAKVINADASATPEVLPWYIDQAQARRRGAQSETDIRAEHAS